MSDLRLMTIPIFVFGLLGYYTYQIKHGVERPSLVIESGQPMIVGDETPDFKFSLDGKWKKPSEAGTAWLAKVWAISSNKGESTSKTEQFICLAPLCANTAVLTIAHSTGATHRNIGQDELDADDLATFFDAIGCKNADDRVAHKFSIPPALGYRLSCPDESPKRSPNVFHLVAHGDATFFVIVMTFPSLGSDVDVALTDEVVNRLAAVQ